MTTETERVLNQWRIRAERAEAHVDYLKDDIKVLAASLAAYQDGIDLVADEADRRLRVEIATGIAQEIALEQDMACLLKWVNQAADDMAGWESAFSEHLPSYAVAISATRNALMNAAASLKAGKA